MDKLAHLLIHNMVHHLQEATDKDLKEALGLHHKDKASIKVEETCPVHSTVHQARVMDGDQIVGVPVDLEDLEVEVDHNHLMARQTNKEAQMEVAQDSVNHLTVRMAHPPLEVTNQQETVNQATSALDLKRRLTPVIYLLVLDLKLLRSLKLVSMEDLVASHHLRMDRLALVGVLAVVQVGEAMAADQAMMTENLM